MVSEGPSGRRMRDGLEWCCKPRGETHGVDGIGTTQERIRRPFGVRTSSRATGRRSGVAAMSSESLLDRSGRQDRESRRCERWLSRMFSRDAISLPRLVEHSLSGWHHRLMLRLRLTCCGCSTPTGGLRWSRRRVPPSHGVAPRRATTLRRIDCSSLLLTRSPGVSILGVWRSRPR